MAESLLFTGKPNIQRTGVDVFSVQDAAGDAGGFRFNIDTSGKKFSLSAISGLFTPSVAATGHIEVEGKDLILFLDVYSNTPDDEAEIIGRRARGTKAAPLPVLAGDCLYDYEAHGWDGAVFGQSNGDVSIIFVAEENFAVGAHGTRIEFWTTPSLTGLRTQKAALKNQGTFILGSPFVPIGTEKLRINDDSGATGGIVWSRAAATARNYSMYVSTIGQLITRDLTGAADRLFLDLSGNFGIGITPNSPYGVPAKMTIGASTAFFNVDATAGTFAAFVLSVAGVAKWAFLNDFTLADNFTLFNAGLVSTMIVTQTGLVSMGLGVGTPVAALEVFDNAALGFRLSRTAATARAWRHFIETTGDWKFTDVTGAALRMTLTVAGGLVLDIITGGLRLNNQVDAAGAAVGTLTNAPSAGNPTFWLPVSIAGAVRKIPCWT